jgi:nitrite reductase/ring-hydroxylating ferredoxin subunit
MTLIEPGARTYFAADRWVLGDYPEPVLIPTERYTSREFLQLEYQKFWPHVWQFACRQEEIPEVGDFLEYTIGDRSVLLVRSEADVIKGFHNACLHRGRTLKVGCGSARELRCGFHAWRWNLNGTIKEVVDPETFHPDSIRPEDLRLPEVLVDIWGGFVFINFDHDAEPLRDFLADLPEYFDDTWPQQLQLSSIRTLVFDANWKVALEAFVEAYHISGTHEQGLWLSDDSLWRRGRSLITGRHASLPAEYGDMSTQETVGEVRRRRGLPYSPRLGPGLEVDERANLVKSLRTLWSERGLMTAPEDMAIAEEISRSEIPEGMTPWSYYRAKVIEDFEATGIKVPPALDAPYMMMFPNVQALYFSGPRTLQVYRFRPYGMDPNKCYYDVMFLRRYPDGQKPTVVREFRDPALTGDDEHDVAEFGLALFQDLRNIPYIQRGLHSLQKPGVRPGMRQEQAVRHLHVCMDAYLMCD